VKNALGRVGHDGGGFGWIIIVTYRISDSAIVIRIEFLGASIVIQIIEIIVTQPQRYFSSKIAVWYRIDGGVIMMHIDSCGLKHLNLWCYTALHGEFYFVYIRKIAEVRAFVKSPHRSSFLRDQGEAGSPRPP
jgi:hypothetical protein